MVILYKNVIDGITFKSVSGVKTGKLILNSIERMVTSITPSLMSNSIPKSQPSLVSLLDPTRGVASLFFDCTLLLCTESVPVYRTISFPFRVSGPEDYGTGQEEGKDEVGSTGNAFSSLSPEVRHGPFFQVSNDWVELFT